MEKVTSHIGLSKWVVLSRWILLIQEFQGKFFYDEDEKRYSRRKLEVEGWNTPWYTDIIKLYFKILLKLRIRNWNGVFIYIDTYTVTSDSWKQACWNFILYWRKVVMHRHFKRMGTCAYTLHKRYRFSSSTRHQLHK